MRKLSVLILLAGCASIASAKCTQVELAGRWNFLIDGLSCQFYLNEQGRVAKGTCYDLFSRPKFDNANETLAWWGNVSVNAYCRVSGSIFSESFCPYGPDEVCQELADNNEYFDSGEQFHQRIEFDLAGRANVHKNVVKGASHDNNPISSRIHHFSMVRY